MRLENKGLLELKKNEAATLAIRIHNLREDINRLTSQHQPIEELDLRKLTVLVNDLVDAREKHAKLCAEIRALCEDLGEKMPDLS
jgi:hypothetical protein